MGWRSPTLLAGAGCLLVLITAPGLVGKQESRPAAAGRAPYSTWTAYGGSADSMQYSSLAQIDTNNVARLEPAWFFPVPDRTGDFGFNPVVVDEVMYVLGPSNSIVALDAKSGTSIWSYAVQGGSPGQRGITYWESRDRSDRRLIYSAGGALQQLDARTGKPILTFGDQGRVVMRTGSPRVLGGPSGTPGRVFENLLITGSNTGEGYFSPPGDIRAFDVVTGKLVWTFHTIPRPGEFGYDTWPPDAWKYAGGANSWGEISIDEKRGIAFVPTGSPTHDLFGGDRKGANLFGNSLLALDARTGKRLWHFQAVHHDLWDYDLTTAPKLMTVSHEGRMVDIVAQATKQGLLFVFDRVTGKPLWPIEERPVPPSDVSGEQAWPTQPFPTKPAPFGRLTFTGKDLNPHLDAEIAASLQKRFLAARSDGVFTPPAIDRETIMMPGQFGGANWGASAADPVTGMLYVRTGHYPTVHQLTAFDPARPRGNAPSATLGRDAYGRLCLACHGEPQPTGIRSMDRTTWIAVATLGGDRVRTRIRQGQGQMPAFGEDVLSDNELRSVLAFLGAAPPAEQPGGPPAGPRPEPEPRVDPGAPKPLSARDEGLALYKGTRYTGPLGRPFRADNGLSSIAPPWSEIVAYDLNRGEIAWRAPFGTSPALAARGIADTGNGRRVWRNGPAVTAGGLLFIGSWADRTVRAFDKATGKPLWAHQLKANPEGLVAVYEAGGRQFVVFCASGSAESESPAEHAFEQWPGLASAQGYYAFALPGSSTAADARD
jgi:quinoprotein glucose dehydrogenase